MKASVVSVFCNAGLLWTLAAGASVPRYFEKHLTTRRDLNSTQIQHELGGQVSNTTLIFGPDDDRFYNATSRWSDFSRPNVQVVIEPGSESDVAKIVQYCNANSVDFLARSGGHGLTASLGAFNGIQISMQHLNTITIQPCRKSAWLGGGALVGQVIHHLWDRGFVTTTGGCECVGMLGAGLGGGHGRYEGLYGMISDNLVQLNVVLANGSSIRVNATSHSDLLWEAAYEESGDVPYSQIAHAQGTSMSDPICQHGSIHCTSTAGLQVYNLTAERLIYEGFKRRAAEDADLAAVTGIMHEGYATAGVEAVDPAGSAYPFRADRHLMFFNAALPHGDSAREEAAWAWAAEVRDHWNAGQPGRPVNAYVNYATGFESLEERYGHESWRIETLRGLKARYDPHNRFRYYNPIVVD
ncbi:FAD-linked oxidoreductase chyH [Colletotrichum liriopes]|uniref:FAD-linked oxidoreductase chyH n=1 Tax=Colletotrichum liriopes TaxID=708192 RepID=A0AA37GYB5_9PEZI|nr:FAD-linked oxidoreductase chyH [Colletotrichum liriopes]